MVLPKFRKHNDIAMHTLLPHGGSTAGNRKTKPLRQHLEEFRMTRSRAHFIVWWWLLTLTRLFTYLTIIAAIMFAINVVQMVLLHRFNSRLWVLGFPAVVFGVLMSILLAWLLYSRTALKKSWDDTERPARIARIGIMCTIILPIICCEFIYLNLAAVPAIRQKIWTTSLNSNSEFQKPSVILFQERWDKDLAVAPDCSTHQPCFQPQKELTAFSFQHNDSLGQAGTIDYLEYDGAGDNITDMSPEGPGLVLDFDVTYSDQPILFTDPFFTVANDLLWFAIFDPRLTNDLGLAFDCSIVSRNIFPVNQSTAVVLSLEQTTITDEVGAITLDSVNSTVTDSSENCNAKSFSNYHSYSYRMIELGGPPDISSCTSNSDNSPPGSCAFTFGLSADSTLVTQRTSQRGISILQMFLDEGAIVGGITFLTWFLSIFVV